MDCFVFCCCCTVCFCFCCYQVCWSVVLLVRVSLLVDVCTSLCLFVCCGFVFAHKKRVSSFLCVVLLPGVAVLSVLSDAMFCLFWSGLLLPACLCLLVCFVFCSVFVDVVVYLLLVCACCFQTYCRMFVLWYVIFVAVFCFASLSDAIDVLCSVIVIPVCLFVFVLFIWVFCFGMFVLFFKQQAQPRGGY